MFLVSCDMTLYIGLSPEIIVCEKVWLEIMYCNLFKIVGVSLV